MLQSIPPSIYEAGAIDGSNPLTDFFHITLPLVLPPLLPVLIASFAFNFNNFSVIYLLTGGGPKMLGDRKSTRLNSSHANISYAVFCLKKKKNKTTGAFGR